MKTEQDASYGVIPYIRENDELRFFIIYQYSGSRQIIYWTFPKGHAENGETQETTAQRELKEETQLTLKSIDVKHPFFIKYDFEDKGVLIKKTVKFFLGEVHKKEFKLQEEEVKNAGWFTYEETREKITFEDTKELLDEVVEYLRNK